MSFEEMMQTIGADGEPFMARAKPALPDQLDITPPSPSPREIEKQAKRLKKERKLAYLGKPKPRGI